MGSHSSTDGRAPLVVIGLDTADLGLLRPWIDEGRLPALGSLMERGCWARIVGTDAMAEFGMGATLFSGRSRLQHGYYYKRQLRPGSYDLEVVSPHQFDAPPFWSELRGGSRRVLVFDAPDAPLLPDVPGCQITNLATHLGAEYEARSLPEGLLDELIERHGTPSPHGVSAGSTAETAAAKCGELLEGVRIKGAMLADLLDRDDDGLIVAFFSETDAASHWLWRYRPGGTAEEQGRSHGLRHALRSVYEAFDEELGRVIALLGEQATVLVVSLYGSRDGYPTSTLPEDFCRLLGYHATRSTSDDGPPLFSPLSLARRFLPESIRVAMSRRASPATQEMLLARRLRESTDWARTEAFAIPSLFDGFLRVNLRGREPHGIVEPGEPYRQLLDRLEADLRVLRDAATGEPAISWIGRTVDLYDCEPPEVLPDLFLEWTAGPRILERVEHPRATLVQRRPTHYTDCLESYEGLFMAAGPQVRQRGDFGDLEILDFAPTLLHACGISSPPSMTGTVRDDLLRAPV